MKDATPIRLVVAGAGAFGREHMRIMAGMADVVLAGVADIHPAAANAAASEYHATQAGTDAVQLLDQVKPDGLVVATPGAVHVALARAARERGIPVLVEKPVAPTMAEAGELAAVERGTGTFVLPGHILRHSEPHRMLAGIAHSGAIGRVISVTSRRHRDAAHAERYAEDPVLMTMVHDIDLAIWLSQASAVEVIALRRPASSKRSETLATVKGNNDAVWRLTTAWTFPTESAPPDRIEVVGDEGSAELEVGSTIRLFSPEPKVIDISSADPDQPLKAELAAFVEGVRTGVRPTMVTLDDAIAGLAVVDAILASLASGEVIRI